MEDLIQRCRVTGDRFLVTSAEQSMLSRLGESNPLIGEPLPLPRIKPAELMRRIFTFGNLSTLYKGRSAISGAALITRFYPADNLPIASPAEYWGDAVDNREFGRDYDFSRPFFDQLAELIRSTYFLPLSNVNVENCDFINGSINSKNCYLCFSVIESRDCLYCQNVYYSSDCVGCAGVWHSSYCYACRDLDNCYECQNCSDCQNSSRLFFCADCRNCQDCLGCVGLDGGRFVAFNRQLDRAAFELELEKAALDTTLGREKAGTLAEELARSLGNKPRRIIASENCSGSYIRRSTNCRHTLHAEECQDCGYLILGTKSKDGWKGFFINSELNYTAGVVGGYGTAYSYWVQGGDSNLYSYYLFNGCSHCFGCVNLKKNSYCLLNKQLTKAEYFEIVPRVIEQMKQTGEWGEFFPQSCCPHYYDESFAGDYIESLPQPELLHRGYRILGAQPQAEPPEAVFGADLPESASAIDSSFLSRPIKCISTGAYFNFQKSELEFYRKHSVPLPRIHWRVRLRNLLDARDKISEDIDVVGSAVI